MAKGLAMGKGKIEAALADRKVQYTGRTGRLSFRPEENELIQLVDGNYTQQLVPGITFHFRNGITREYDPNVPEDAEFIKAADEFIASGDYRVAKYQIQRVNHGKLVAPWPTWDKQNIKSITDMVAQMESPDFEHMVGYELQQEKPRRSLIAKLEAMAETEPEPVAEDLDKAPVL